MATGSDLIRSNIALGATSIASGRLLSWPTLGDESSINSSGPNAALSAGASQSESATLTVPTYGTNYVSAIADDFSNVTNRSDASNDLQHLAASSTLSATTGLSDLIPTNITLGSTSVAPGGSLNVNWSILNQGSAAANSTSTTEVRITSSPTSASGTNLAGVSTSALAAGASQAESATLTVPTTAGTYYVWVIADDFSNVTNQSNTSNDLQHSLSFTVSPPPPPPPPPPTQSDLIPTNIKLGSTSVVVGGALGVNWSILNQGSAAANSTSTTEVRITSSPTSASGTNLAGVSTSALAAGASQAESATLTVPTTPGTYYVWVIADDFTNVTNQSNTSNDLQHSAAFTVTAAPQPNLVVSNVSVSSASITTGGSDTLNFTVKNAGNATAASSTLGIYLSSDSTISTTDTLVTTVSISSLAAGATKSGSVAVTMPATLGTYYLGAIADYNDAITESSYADNVSTAVPITVTPTGVNLVVTSVSVTSSSVMAGANDTIGFTVKNSGNATAASSTLGIYLSSDATITTGDTLITTVSIGSLGAGATKSGTVTVAMPTTTGTYYLGAIADYNNGITESSYSDNASAGVQVNVTSPGAGFDREFFPGSTAMADLIKGTNLRWCGYYLDAPSQRLNTGWLGEQSYLTSLGWKIAPLYVGQQDTDPTFEALHPNYSYNTNAAQGVIDGQQAVAEMGPDTGAKQTVYAYDTKTGKYDIAKTVAQGQGFAAGTTVFLDWENAPISVGNDTDYIVAWCQTVASSAYRPGIYCKASDISVIAPLVAAYNVQFWAATWPPQPSVPSTTTQFSTTDPTGGSTIATSWQYGTGYSIQTPHGLINGVDLDSSNFFGGSQPSINSAASNLVSAASVPNSSVTAPVAADALITAKGTELNEHTDSNGGTVALPAAAGHMSDEAYANLPDIIDKSALVLLPKARLEATSEASDDSDKRITQLIQSIAAFGTGDAGLNWSRSTHDHASPSDFIAFTPPGHHHT